MLKTQRKKRLFLIIIIATFLSVAMLVFVNLTTPSHAVGEENKTYVLKTHGDFLALFYGEEVVEIYENIVISSLPILDQEQFLKGITIKSKDNVGEILEDFE